jgi:hypothetical protein
MSTPPLGKIASIADNIGTTERILENCSRIDRRLLGWMASGAKVGRRNGLASKVVTRTLRSAT